MSSPRVLKLEALVPAPIADVWTAWTTRDGLTTFLAPDARVAARPGGPFDILFLPEAPVGERGSEGCTVVTVSEPHRFAFRWNFPPELPAIRNEHTQVTLDLESAAGGGTRVLLTQTGWQEGPDWDAGYAYFADAWDLVLKRLAHRFAAGPIDWENPWRPEA